MATRKTKAKSSRRRQVPSTVNGTVPPRRVGNVTRRPREYLTFKEIGLLMGTARERARYGHRGATMMVASYRHGLRPGELCALSWDQVHLGNDLLRARRLKSGTPSVHPMSGNEIRALRKLKRDGPQSR